MNQASKVHRGVTGREGEFSRRRWMRMRIPRGHSSLLLLLRLEQRSPASTPLLIPTARIPFPPQPTCCPCLMQWGKSEQNCMNGGTDGWAAGGVWMGERGQ